MEAKKKGEIVRLVNRGGGKNITQSIFRSGKKYLGSHYSCWEMCMTRRGYWNIGDSNALHTFRLLGNALYMIRYLVKLLGNTLYTFRWLGNAMQAYTFSIKDELKYSCRLV